MSEPIIAARQLHKHFGAVVAANDVTLEFGAGEIVGIIGANGAGKTTFVNMVTGYIKPDQGRILFRGKDVTRLSPREVTRLGIRRSFQVAQLFPNLCVRDNVISRARLRRARAAFADRRAALDRAHCARRRDPRAARAGGCRRARDHRAAAGAAQASRHRARHGRPLGGVAA